MRALLTRLVHHRLATPALLAAGALGAFAVLRTLDPTRPGSGLPPCPFWWLTGLYCPGCGSTRALHGLAHFDLAAAWSMNPLLVLSLPALLLLTGLGAGVLPAALVPLARQLCRPVAWGVLLVGYGMLRNLPWYPFNLLAPG